MYAQVGTNISKKEIWFIANIVKKLAMCMDLLESLSSPSQNPLRLQWEQSLE